MYIRIKNLREDRDYNQSRISQYLNCSQSAYSRIENGIQDVHTQFLKKLAKLYGVTTDFLLEMDKE
ncbi:helix-turn-helix transcriptional regulator [Streptococcus equi subsp. zooepidemicus]|uniref:Cro/CI family transcriptional regulator n=1 Tax=Streptococcus equi subsp. zooepidemicus TaxID=40041 RepID=A0AAX2LGK3_STRSZ|nr:helix-turn-helix transcriptional regulator [Streptococcus equi]KIS06406.1 Cro/CI family transcriptional regulator [Streptococcus equi subsp. zooepidemicus Sz16]KIS16922.1 Cro/CI family transcriptional regulator [Streptococcus equi subsp. zooepidemicus SzAM35]MCD3433349.1 helix-turn-helix transcriptional regulator [Streptococcus equi subsp. zooepidemicus]MCD3443571.1 helix-turn-helix transcriptional regulator [Streptococcus equi subsp. zooepidemicus]MDI5945572.1 helix-turn-helix transcriptio